MRNFVVLAIGFSVGFVYSNLETRVYMARSDALTREVKKLTDEIAGMEQFLTAVSAQCKDSYTKDQKNFSRYKMCIALAFDFPEIVNQPDSKP
jgi:hypothetical protein